MTDSNSVKKIQNEPENTVSSHPNCVHFDLKNQVSSKDESIEVFRKENKLERSEIASILSRGNPSKEKGSFVSRNKYDLKNRNLPNYQSVIMKARHSFFKIFKSKPFLKAKISSGFPKPYRLRSKNSSKSHNASFKIEDLTSLKTDSNSVDSNLCELESEISSKQQSILVEAKHIPFSPSESNLLAQKRYESQNEISPESKAVVSTLHCEPEDMKSSKHCTITSETKNPLSFNSETCSVDVKQCEQTIEEASKYSTMISMTKCSLHSYTGSSSLENNQSEPKNQNSVKLKSVLFETNNSPFFKFESKSVAHKLCESGNSNSLRNIPFLTNESNSSSKAESSSIPQKQYKPENENSSKDISVFLEKRNILCSNVEVSLAAHRQNESMNKTISKQEAILPEANNPSFSNTETISASHKQCEPENEILSKQKPVFIQEKNPLYSYQSSNLFNDKQCEIIENISKYQTEISDLKIPLSSDVRLVDNEHFESDSNNPSKHHIIISETNNPTTFNNQSSLIAYMHQESKNTISSENQLMLTKAKIPSFYKVESPPISPKQCEPDNNYSSKQQDFLIETKSSSSCNSEISSAVNKKCEMENGISSKLQLFPFEANIPCLLSSKIRSVDHKQHKPENDNSSNHVKQTQLLATDKYTNLNLSFKPEDIKECMDYLIEKYSVFPTATADNIPGEPLIPNANINAATSQNSYQPMENFNALFSPSNVDVVKPNHSTCSLVSLEKKRKSGKLNDSSEFTLKKLKLDESQKFCINKKNFKSIQILSKQNARFPITPVLHTEQKGMSSKLLISDNIAKTNTQKIKIPRDTQSLKNLISLSRPPDSQTLSKQLISAISVIQNSELSASTQPDASSNRNKLFKRSHSSVKKKVSKLKKHVSVSECDQVEDIVFIIIKWNVDWLSLQNDSCTHPPIWGENEIREVKNVYKSDTEYFKTYNGLLLLGVWLNVYTSWWNNFYHHQCQLISCDVENSHFINTCQAIMFYNEPIQHSIVLVTYIRPDRCTQRLFGYIYNERVRHYKYCRRNGHRMCVKKVLLYFYTSEKIDTFINSTIIIQILCKLEVATRLSAALVLSELSTLTNVILDPMNNAETIRVVQLPLDYFEALQVQIDKIIFCKTFKKTLFTLVQRPQGMDTSLGILKIIHHCFLNHFTTLVCLRNTKTFLKVANHLKDFKSTLFAVKESEVMMPTELQQNLLSERVSNLPEMTLDTAELTVLQNSKIVLTMRSGISLSCRKTPVFGPNLVCIIDDAHLSTEAETALPLSYKPKKVVLFGDCLEHSRLHPFLLRLGYHRSLFHRLYICSE